MKKIIFAAFFFFIAPSVVFSAIRINEISWMGDLVSSDHEWVELYNDSDSSQDLSGWKLSAFDTADTAKEKFSLALSRIIPAKGYFLIEKKRGATDTAPYLSSDFTTASFSLVNTGETLLLKNSDGSQTNEIKSLATSWQAGDNTTKETMQWNGLAWITAKATPKLENASIGTIKTSTDTTNTSSSDTTTTTSISAHLSPLPLSDFSNNQEFFVSAGRDRVTPAGGTLPFEGYVLDSKNKKADGVSFSWVFGDGSNTTGAKVSHIYEYPGNYIVILNAELNGSRAVSRANILVFAPDITLSLQETEDGEVITISNNSVYELNIGGWKLRLGDTTYLFPEDTLVGAENEITLSPSLTKFKTGVLSKATLLLPNDKIVSESGGFVAEEKKTPTQTAPDISSGKNEKTAVIVLPAVPTNITVTPTHTSSAVPKIKKSTQYAAVIDVSKKEETSGGEEKMQTLAIKKPEGIFSKIWHLFFVNEH
jgi:hypothetical protein